MDRYLESAEELTAAMEKLSSAEALTRFIDWLERHDKVIDHVTVDNLASTLEHVATELRVEAVDVPGERTPGLAVAAAVLTDSAQGVRSGETLAEITGDGGTGGGPRR